MGMQADFVATVVPTLTESIRLPSIGCPFGMFCPVTCSNTLLMPSVGASG